MFFVRTSLLLGILAALLTMACNAPQQIARQNTAFTYYKSTGRINPQYKIYHSGADSSTLYFSIKQSNLLYTRSNTTFAAKVKIQYLLFDNFDSKTPVDTASKYFSFIEQTDTNTLVSGNFKFKAATGRQYVLQIICYDVNRKVYNQSIIEIDKQNPFTSQFFLLKSYPDSSVLFSTYPSKNQAFTITVPDTAITRLTVKYYPGEIPPAPAPFSDEPEIRIPKPDTLFTIPVSQGQSDAVQWISQGLYVVCADTASGFGLPILRPYEDYPLLTQAENVLKPLRYLTAKDEYERLVKAENTKKAVDDFWLRSSGTATHARDVLKNYYTGVSLANRFFTTTREGWKTDRGMVYSIFGQPFSVYRSGNTETWMYGSSNTPFTPVFTFEKRNDGIAGYDYFLRRSDLLKPAWYEMVENWRNGRLVYWY